MPPVVTHVSQVIPLRTLELIAVWWKQLQRSFALVQKGKLKQAIRLRPLDLWLPHDEHSVPETAQWNWDLRPLADGEPAQVIRGSTVDEPPVGGMNRDRVRQVLRNGRFDDVAICQEVLQGVSDDSDAVRGVLLCAPHKGAYEHLDQAMAKVDASIVEGWCSKPFQGLPCYPLRSSPYSVVDESIRAGKPKFRLTTDLSWPQPGMIDGVQSINHTMQRSKWPINKLMKVTDYSEAVAVLKNASSRFPVKLWSIDCVAFYRQVTRQN